MELIIIGAALTVFAVAMAWSGNRAAIEVERTLRLAIEQGILTDPALIPKLREPAGLSWTERLLLSGTMIMFAAGGLLVVAAVMSIAGNGLPLPLFALAGFAASLAAGLIFCGRRLMRWRANS